VSAPRLVDLSHAVEHGLVTYPGLPAPVISDFLTREASEGQYAPGTTFHIARIEMVANTGTYVDSPFHRHVAGADLAGLPLERLAHLDGVVIDARRRTGRAVDAEAFDGHQLGGRAVLVCTGWDRHWQTPRYAEGHPFLPRRTVERLVAAGPALVGIDSLNIDDTTDPERPAHSLLLGAGIPVAEHLCHLDALPLTGFRFHCVPAKFRGVGTFPVRAYAVIG
jgi:arylformamidase